MPGGGGRPRVAHMKATFLMITLVASVGCASLENKSSDQRRLEGVALTADESADVIEKEIRKAKKERCKFCKRFTCVC